jgi:hypothetical protein
MFSSQVCVQHFPNNSEPIYRRVERERWCSLQHVNCVKSAAALPFIPCFFDSEHYGAYSSAKCVLNTVIIIIIF